MPFELGLYSRKHGKIGFKVCPPAFLASFPHGGLSVAFPGAASSVRSIPNVSPRLEGARQGKRFPFHINRDLSYFFFYRIYSYGTERRALGTQWRGRGTVWRASAVFSGDAVLNGAVRGTLWRACPSSKGKTHPSSPIVSRWAASSLPRILRAAPGWSPASSANSLG